MSNLIVYSNHIGSVNKKKRYIKDNTSIVTPSISSVQQNNKKIVSNMESVIHEVKRKHKKAARQRKLNNSIEQPEICDISNSLSSNLHLVSPTTTQLNGESPKDSNNIEQIDCKLTDESKNESTNTAPPPTSSSSSTPSNPIKLNAFHIMMNSQNKSIGLNPSGKELTSTDKENKTTNDSVKQLKKQRNQMLSEWADRKGNLKRKQLDEAKDIYIKNELNKRAKRFKKLLENSNDRKQSTIKYKSDDADDENDNNCTATKPITDTDSENSSDVAWSPNKHEKSDRKFNRIKKTTKKSKKEDNFLDKLSSPLKKRDSLYGYFEKKDIQSPKEDEIIDNNIENTDNLRRSTRLSINKKINLENENVKNETSKRIKARRSSIIELSDDSMSDNRKSNSSKKFNGDTSSTNVALAPIFNKSQKKSKSKEDQTRIEARKEFLLSGIPEKMKQEIERQRAYTDLFENSEEIFPIISHICQLNETDEYDENLNIKFMINIDQLDSPIDMPSVDKLMKLLIINDNHINKIPMNPEKINKFTEKDGKILTKQLKIEYGNFPIYRCYKQLIRKQKLYANDNLLFTEKYKSIIFDEILVNSSPVLELKEFLITWQQQEKFPTDTNNSANDLGDFEDDDTTSRSTTILSQNNNAIVLCGSSGTGKTNAVYTLANELNFAVLEIHAGCKRSGKLFLKQLQEATQSHQVNDQKLLETVFESFANNCNTIERNQINKKLSLILIEDADCLLDEDQGFIEAINQLILISKRPVILIINNLNCNYLNDIIEQNLIEFHPPNIENIGKWLSILTIVERGYIKNKFIENLYKFNKCDLRKTINDIQFYVLSSGGSGGGGDDHRINESNSINLLEFYISQNHQTSSGNYNSIINRNPEILNLFWCNSSDALKNSTNREDEHQQFKNILDFYTNISSAIKISRNDFNENEITNNLSLDITQELICRSMNNKLSAKEVNFMEFFTYPRKREREKISDYIKTNVLLHEKCEDIDYEPCLREICRIEKQRSDADVGRSSSRFYHYLRNSASVQPNLFDQHCSILQ